VEGEEEAEEVADETQWRTQNLISA
jgi:hypothetical protein